MTDTKNIKIYCFLGLPASGKGTQVNILAQKTGAQVLGMGNLIREDIEQADLTDPFYLDMKDKYDKGIPQSDQVIFDIVRKHLNYHKNKDIIFDNFPFSSEQAKLFFDLCEELGHKPILIIVNVDPKTALNRIVHRKVCSLCEAVYVDGEASMCEKCGGALVSRSDDTVETVEKRIEFYLPRIKEVKEIFSSHDSVCDINGEGSISEVTRLITQALNDIK